MDFLFSYEFNVDSQIDKLETIEKNESILCSFTKSLLDTVFMYLLFDISSGQSLSFYFSLSLTISLTLYLSLSYVVHIKIFPNFPLF